MKRKCMAEEIILSDAYVMLSFEARALYITLLFFADDDGVVNNAIITARLIGTNEKALEELINKKFIIYFEESGVCVVKHWWIHNPKRSDRYRASKYSEIMSKLLLGNDKTYRLKNQKSDTMATTWQPLGNHSADEYVNKCNVMECNIKTIDHPKTTTSLPLVDDTVNELQNDTVNDTKNDVPKKTVQNRISLFDEFWNNYPRKIGKQKCANWFRIHKADKLLLDKMLNAINEQKQSEQWRRDNGQYIPHPYTWLNQGRWEDETEIDLTAKPTEQQIEAQERKEVKMAEMNNKEHIALLKARLAEATPNSKYAYSLELEIQVAQGKTTEEEAERKLIEYNPVDMDIPLSTIDFSAMKGIKKL